ncbi:hypothetical protein AA313_de0203909 [Arthrobotrys entomopaga]|nr:hypothetical protein AA313_de0203909 [Arthrobotrys entomopaga]
MGGLLSDGMGLKGSVKAVVVVVSDTNTTANATLKFESLEIPTSHPIFNFTENGGTTTRVHEPTFAETYGFPIRTFMYTTTTTTAQHHSPSTAPAPAPPEMVTGMGTGIGTGRITTLKDFIERLFPTVEIVQSQPTQPKTTTDEEEEEEVEGQYRDPGYPTIKSIEWDDHRKSNINNTIAVLIARRDGKDVEVAHVKAFAEFCGYLESVWERYDLFMKNKKKKNKENKKKGEKMEWEDVVVIDRMYSVLERDAFRVFWEEGMHKSMHAKDEGHGPL